MGDEKQVEYSYLKSVAVKGYRNLKDVQVSFEPGLNIIIGQNGVGKSNLLKLLNEFCTAGETAQLGDRFEAIIKHDLNNIKVVFEKLPATTRNPNNRLVHKKNKFIQVNNCSIYINGAITANDYDYFTDILTDNEFYPYLVEFNLPGGPFFLLEPSLFEAEITTKNNTGEVFIEPHIDLSFEIPFLAYHIFSSWKYNSDVEKVVVENICFENEIINNLRKFSPIKDIRLSDISIQQHENIIRVSNIYFEFLVNDEWLSWAFLSDGTKRLFYLIHQVTRGNSMVLIEEPELGVHPHQFHLLMLFLKEQAEYKQIILTTHSPYALNVLEKEDLDGIIIAKLDKEKGAVFEHLKPNKKAKASHFMTEVAFLSDYWMDADLEENED